CAADAGRGTSSGVLLPAAKDAVAQPRAESDRGRAARAEMRLRVLVVDDEAPIRELLRSVMSLRGHDVQCVADGEEGLVAFSAASFDVTVVDYQMPRMNGTAFLTALGSRAEGRKVRKILVTGLPPSEVEMPPGLDLLLEKPYSVQDIVAAIEGRLETAVPLK